MKGFHIERIYLVHCEQCNMEITRSENGEDCTTRAEAEEAARQHAELHTYDEGQPESPWAVGLNRF